MESIGGLSDDAVGTIMVFRRRDDPVCIVGTRLEAGWEVSLSPIGHGVFADQVEATFDPEFMLDPGRLMVLPVPAAEITGTPIRTVQDWIARGSGLARTALD